MSTVAEIIDRLSKLDPTAIVAIPTIWDKETAIDVYEYANNETVSITDEQWAEIVSQFEDAEFYDESAMIEAIDEVLGK